MIPPGVRVTVRIESVAKGGGGNAGGSAGEADGAEDGPPFAGTAVPPNTPREQARCLMSHETTACVRARCCPSARSLRLRCPCKCNARWPLPAHAISADGMCARAACAAVFSAFAQGIYWGFSTRSATTPQEAVGGCPFPGGCVAGSRQETESHCGLAQRAHARGEVAASITAASAAGLTD